MTASITSRIPDLIRKKEAKPSLKRIEEDKFRGKKKKKLRKMDEKEKYILKIAKNINYHSERIAVWLERKPMIRLVFMFAALITVLTFLFNVVTFFIKI